MAKSRISHPYLLHGQLFHGFAPTHENVMHNHSDNDNGDILFDHNIQIEITIYK